VIRVIDTEGGMSASCSADLTVVNCWRHGTMPYRVH